MRLLLIFKNGRLLQIDSDIKPSKYFIVNPRLHVLYLRVIPDIEVVTACQMHNHFYLKTTINKEVGV